MVPKRTIFLIVGLLVVLGLVAVGWFAFRPHAFAGTPLNLPAEAHDFALTGTDSQPVSLGSLRGKWLLVFFGYTSCPDVCPTTLHDLKQVLSDLGSKADQVRVVFISVDPEKDTPQVMKSYLGSIDPRMIGLTGDLPTITQVASDWGIFFEKKPSGQSGDYTVDHTAVVQLVDPEGRVREVFSYGTPASGITADVRYFLTHPK